MGCGYVDVTFEMTGHPYRMAELSSRVHLP
jgi:hypothetical protein